jgi:hypothetical protein
MACNDFQRALVDKEEYYDVCDATLSVYPQRASLKSMPATVGIEPNLFLSSVPMCRNTYLHKHYKYFF